MHGYNLESKTFDNPRCKYILFDVGYNNKID